MFESIRVVKKGSSPVVIFAHFQDEPLPASVRTHAKSLGHEAALKDAAGVSKPPANAVRFRSRSAATRGCC